MMKILSCLQYVPANEIWPKSTSFIDEGERQGLVRGYNVEVKKYDGEVFWMSAVYIRTTIEKYLEDEFTQFYYSDLGVTPTGRICFRGYGTEEYDNIERDIFINPCDREGNPLNSKKCVSA